MYLKQGRVPYLIFGDPASLPDGLGQFRNRYLRDLFPGIRAGRYGTYRKTDFQFAIKTKKSVGTVVVEITRAAIRLGSGVISMDVIVPAMVATRLNERPFKVYSLPGSDSGSLERPMILPSLLANTLNGL